MSKYNFSFDDLIGKLKKIDKMEIPKNYQLVETESDAKKDSKSSKQYKNSIIKR
jgi:hypothetical protein